MASPRRFPIRTCVACRTERQKRDLVRLVRTPERSIMLDPTGRLAGRGAYLCADGACWSTALKKGALERALEAPLPVELREQLQSGTMTIKTGGTPLGT
ncbi:MAG: YlxR family protein [Chloroflexi bacterium]|nr:YlxR family protein [Chloroflexota bacterium]